jgi:putative ABC transport system permease protein
MRVLHRKLYRTIGHNWGQSLAVAAVVLCGIASYIAVYSAYLNLMLTRDTYYQQYRFADFEIMVERAPATAVFKLEDLPGVRQARGRIIGEVNVDIPGIEEPRMGRIVSMPVPRQPVLNDIVIRRGRYFEPGAQDEVILSERFALANQVDVGDRIEASIDNRKYSLRIVGLALSPEYVYMIRNVQELVPAPERFGILWLPEEFAEAALNMQEAFNNIIGMVDDPGQLDRLFTDVDNLLSGYGVFAKVKQEDQISNRFVSDEIKNLGVSATITPTIFLSVAAMILLVLLNRMVRTERTQIGLLRAYGYSRFAIARHYLEYGLALAIAGCLGGFVVGQWLSSGMIRLYVQFYQFPLLESRVYPEVLTRSMGITILFATAGALMAAVQAARIHPAESMRPEAPPVGHRVWLEAIPAVWRRLSFTWKMIARNISRNAFRAAFNVFGVAVSTGLLIMGFFTMDSMDFALTFQFEEVQREDLKVGFHQEQGKGTYYDIARLPHVRRAEPVIEYPFEARSGWRRKDIIVTGLPQGAELQKIMRFDRIETPLPENGLVLVDRLAQELGVRPGDTITLKPLMGRVEKEVEVVVRQTVEQFLGLSAYMDHTALSRLLDEPFMMTSALLRIEEDAERAVSRSLKDIAGIASVSYSKDAYQSLLDTIAQSMWITNTMLLLFAGIIAFSIIYNVT